MWRQAAVRAYRMGQAKPVFVYRLVAAGTMEQFVYDRQAMPRQMIDRLVELPIWSNIYHGALRLRPPGNAAPKD